MQQQSAIDEAGNIWEIDAQGNPVRLVSPASATAPGVTALTGPKPEKAPAVDPNADLRRQLLTAQVASAQASAAKARQGTAGAKAGDTKSQQRTANLKALRSQIGRVRELYAKSLKGGAPNWIAGNVPDAFRPENGAFQSAADGLGEIGMSAFRVPGVGAQSDTELRQFVSANTPQPGDSDAKIEEKLRTLENRLSATEQEIGLAETPASSPADAYQQQQRTEVATGDTKVERSQSAQDKRIASLLARGASAEQIKREANGQYPKLDSVLAWRALNPTYKGSYDVSTERVVPTTMLNKVMASPLATIATQGVNAATGGLLDEAGGAVQSLLTGEPLSDTIAAADLAKQAQAQLNPKSAFAGNVLGGAAALAGGAALLPKLGISGGFRGAGLAGDAAYGALYGAGENNDNRLLGGATGAAAGVVGNRIGAGITRGAGATMRGVVNPAVNRLRERGVDLTGGEMLGGWVKGVEDRLEGFPGVGDLLARRNATSRRQLNEAAFNEGGATVGAPINASGVKGLELLERAKSNAYDQALNPVSIDANDPGFLGNMSALVAASNRIPPVNGARDAAAAAIESRIGGAVDPATETISGRGFQEAYRGLARTAKERAAGDYGHEIGQVMRQGQDALADALPPEALEGFIKANSANRHLSVLTDAVNAAKGQLDNGDALFTPAQLGTATTNNTKKYGGKLSAAIGERPFDQLARDAQEVMSSKVSDSGTAGRVALGAALTGGLGGVGGYAGGTEGAATGIGVGLAPLGVMAALNTRAGQAALAKALLQRTAAFRNLGQGVVNSAPRVGDFTGLLSVLGSQSALPPR